MPGFIGLPALAFWVLAALAFWPLYLSKGFAHLPLSVALLFGVACALGSWRRASVQVLGVRVGGVG